MWLMELAVRGKANVNYWCGPLPSPSPMPDFKTAMRSLRTQDRCLRHRPCHVTLPAMSRALAAMRSCLRHRPRCNPRPIAPDAIHASAIAHAMSRYAPPPMQSKTVAVALAPTVASHIAPMQSPMPDFNTAIDFSFSGRRR